jgi:hypothetical protein
LQVFKSNVGPAIINMMNAFTEIWIIVLNQSTADYIFTDRAMLGDPAPLIL